jgi:hypothetical protein
MAINPHHTVEELNDIRCSIVERNLSSERADFLKSILESSGLHVVVAADAEGKSTVGVTDITFNPIHALYSRRLKTPEGQLVTPSYWYQKEINAGFYWEYKKK